MWGMQKLSTYETMLIEILRLKLKEIKFDNGIDQKRKQIYE